MLLVFENESGTERCSVTMQQHFASQNNINHFCGHFIPFIMLLQVSGYIVTI